MITIATDQGNTLHVEETVVQRFDESGCEEQESGEVLLHRGVDIVKLVRGYLEVLFKLKWV